MQVRLPPLVFSALNLIDLAHLANGRVDLYNHELSVIVTIGIDVVIAICSHL